MIIKYLGSAFAARLGRKLSIAATTAVFLSVALMLTFSAESQLDDSLLEMLSATSAGLIGTVIALAYTLSVIPIEKAANDFSPYILRLYGQDRSTRWCFIVLSLCLLLSITLIFGWFLPIAESAWLIAQITALGVVVDCLRVVRARLLFFLDPRNAIGVLKDHIRECSLSENKKIASVEKLISLQPNGADLLSDPNQRKQVLAVLHSRSSSLERIIIEATEELYEMAIKSISSSDQRIPNLVIDAYYEVTTEYLSSREDSNIFSSIPGFELAGLQGASTSAVTDKIYDQLLNINLAALEHKLELVSVRTVRCLGELLKYNMGVVVETKLQRLAPLAFSAAFYLKKSVSDAQKRGFIEPLLQAFREIKIALSCLKEDVDYQELEGELIGVLGNCTIAAYAAKDEIVASQAQKTLLHAIRVIIDKKHSDKEFLIQDALARIRYATPRAVQMEKLGGHSIGNPYPPYALTNTDSIAYLFALSSKLIDDEDAKETYRASLYDYLAMANVFYKHFRSVCDEYSLHGSLIEGQFLDSINECCKCLLGNIVKGRESGHVPDDVLNNKFIWFICLFGWVFNKSSSVSTRNTETAASYILELGLNCLIEGFDDLAFEASKVLGWLMRLLQEKDSNSDPYAYADIMVCAWLLKIAARKRSGRHYAQLIGKALEQPNNIKSMDWIKILNAFENRKSHARDRFDQVERGYGMPGDAMPAFKRAFYLDKDGTK